MRSDININIVVETLKDHFLISPNELHRAEGDYTGMTMLERGYLAALLSLPAEFQTSRSAIDGLAPELGRDKISQVLRGLREKRFLYIKRFNTGRGKFTWQWRVYMRRRPIDFDPWQETPTIDGSAVNGHHMRQQAISAGRTIDGESVTDTTSTKEEVPGVEVPEEPPYPPLPETSGPSPRKTATGGDPHQGNNPIDDAADAALRHQPGWKRASVVAAIRQAINGGLPDGVAYRTIVDLAEGTRYGPTTTGPQRLCARGPWWTPGAVFVPGAEAGTTEACAKHPGQPAASCSCCTGETLGHDPVTDSVVNDKRMNREQALAAMRAKTQRRPAPASSRP